MSRLTYTTLSNKIASNKIWERESSEGQASVGAFKLNDVYNDFYLYPTEAWELESFLKNVPKKETEKFFRYETATSKIGGFKPVIKINMESGLVYFQSDSESETILFDKISAKPIWININSNQK